MKSVILFLSLAVIASGANTPNNTPDLTSSDLVVVTSTLAGYNRQLEQRIEKLLNSNIRRVGLTFGHKDMLPKTAESDVKSLLLIISDINNEMASMMGKINSKLQAVTEDSVKSDLQTVHSFLTKIDERNRLVQLAVDNDISYVEVDTLRNAGYFDFGEINDVVVRLYNQID